MRNEMPAVKNFEDTEVWNDAIDFAVMVYQSVKLFPDFEKFGIASQLRRASSSISANLAEGYGRHGKKEKLQFYSIAYGSLLETKSFLYLSLKLGYIESIDVLLGKATSLSKQINAIKRSLA